MLKETSGWKIRVTCAIRRYASRVQNIVLLKITLVMSLFKSIFLNELVLVVRVLLNHSYFVGNPWQRLVTFNNRMILTQGTHVDKCFPSYRHWGCFYIQGDNTNVEIIKVLWTSTSQRTNVWKTVLAVTILAKTLSLTHAFIALGILESRWVFETKRQKDRMFRTQWSQWGQQ